MKLLINGTAYPCIGRPRFNDPVQFELPEDKPDAASLGDNLILIDNAGNELRQVDISGMARRYFEGDNLIATATPEPEPVEPVEPSTTLEERVSACETAIEAIISEDTGEVAT